MSTFSHFHRYSATEGGAVFDLLLLHLLILLIYNLTYAIDSEVPTFETIDNTEEEKKSKNSVLFPLIVVDSVSSNDKYEWQIISYKASKLIDILPP